MPLPSPGDLPHPGSEPRSPALQVNSLLSEPPGDPRKVQGSKKELWQECWAPQAGSDAVMAQGDHVDKERMFRSTVTQFLFSLKIFTYVFARPGLSCMWDLQGWLVTVSCSPWDLAP